jgi:uncharacterized protein (TIGR03083 family)
VSFTDSDKILSETLTDTWSSLGHLLRNLSADHWQSPTDLPGWNVQAIVSHLIGFEQQWFLGRDAQVPPLDPLPSHVHNDVASGNERWVRQWEDLSPAAMISEWDAMVEARTKQINAARFYPQGFDTLIRTFRGDLPMRDALRTRIVDVAIHQEDIRRACELPWNPDGSGIEFVRSEMINSLGYVAAKQAKLPDGTAIAMTLFGSHQITLAVVVEGGRGRLVQPSDSVPVAAVTMHDETFILTTAGRVNAEDAIDSRRIILRGNTEVARQFAQHLRVLTF